ncbi:DUF2062 domain-containing protein [Seonamhaeicola marinus]|uniref:DUF2062 domain-containing protein n=1 Tax=Seonamhaeicola marinus TaxID=1912246 RepID=A0A5D0HRK6_9FLAO|nr:DUF2062 domain-containing protein [Seonamhaeicola marinus]TYA73964.1 DUF2062 domain-containing protein [Seonamhaeicola marinus]
MSKTLESINQRLKALNICVLIPTYNNENTLKRVIDGVLNYTQDIIIVNDGSTDTTGQILSNYASLQQIHLPENKGKGNALRRGFKEAYAKGYAYAITIDSDGQHFPDDIEVFLKTLETSKNKNLLLIGARDMSQDGVPGKSSFGNKFSNFWFWFETGIKLSDTQSGYRLYPLNTINDIRLITNKFEFEIEVIVKAAWKDVEVKNVPVKVLYDESERVSHFRPFKDFTRISILNTCLVFITIFYITPRNLFRRLKKKGIKRFIIEDFLGSTDSPTKKALSVALGVLIGLSPFWGFHTLIVISLAVLFRLNKVIAFTFSNVSLPPFIPFVVLTSFKVGQFVLGTNYTYSIEEMTQNFEVVKHLKVYIIGSFTFAIVASIVLGFISFLLFSVLSKKNSLVSNA